LAQEVTVQGRQNSEGCKNCNAFVRKRLADRDGTAGSAVALHRCKAHSEINKCKQEGQHPLTGQRGANFRLLAN